MAKCIWRKSIAVALGAISLAGTGHDRLRSPELSPPAHGRGGSPSRRCPTLGPIWSAAARFCCGSRAPPGGDVRVTANGQDVTANFAGQTDGSMLGLVTGLHDGTNTIEAQLAGTTGPISTRRCG